MKRKAKKRARKPRFVDVYFTVPPELLDEVQRIGKAAGVKPSEVMKVFLAAAVGKRVESAK